MQAFMDYLYRLLSLTAWKIDPPKAYGVFHISFFVIGVLICIFAAYKLRNISDRGNKILLLTLGGYLIVCEIYKQLFYFFIIKQGVGYSWGDFPFHLCSVPMYLCILVPLLKPGKLQKSLCSFLMLYNFLSGGIAFAEPSGLLHPYATITAHSMIWHMLLVFIGLYLLFSGRGGFELCDYWSATKVFFVLCVIAFSLNLSFWDISNGQINAFFIGPRNSSLIVFKQISEAFGWYFSTLLYIPAVCLGSYIIFLFVRLYHKQPIRDVLPFKKRNNVLPKGD